MRQIFPSGMAKPVGHYSPAVEHNGLIYVSGQLPLDLESREPFTGDIGKQTELALRNVENVLKAAGSGLGSVLQMTVYISDRELWSEVNEAYARVMGGHRPARAIIPVKELNYGTKIEIQAIAAVSE